MMEYLNVILISLFSLIALFILTKINGNKQMTELTMFDYITGITIGSIAAEMATELEKPLKPLTAMAVYALSAILISKMNEKFVKVRNFFFGKAIILMRNGKIYKESLKKGRIDLNEFLMQARTNGYFDISAINTAILEPSGKISFMPFSQNRPVTPDDLKILPASDDIFANVIMDGKLMKDNLTAIGKDENWLKSELKNQGIKSYNDVFLGILDTNGTLNIFKMDEKINNTDIYS